MKRLLTLCSVCPFEGLHLDFSRLAMVQVAPPGPVTGLHRNALSGASPASLGLEAGRCTSGTTSRALFILATNTQRKTLWDCKGKRLHRPCWEKRKKKCVLFLPAQTIQQSQPPHSGPAKPITRAARAARDFRCFRPPIRWFLAIAGCGARTRARLRPLHSRDCQPPFPAFNQ